MKQLFSEVDACLRNNLLAYSKDKNHHRTNSNYIAKILKLILIVVQDNCLINIHFIKVCVFVIISFFCIKLSLLCMDPWFCLKLYKKLRVTHCKNTTTTYTAL